MKWFRAFLITSCLGFSIYLNRSVSRDLDPGEQLLPVLTGFALLLVCIITLLLSHLHKPPGSSKASLVTGWLITAIFAIEMLGTTLAYLVRSDVEQEIQSIQFAGVDYDSEGFFVLDGVIGAHTTSSLSSLLAIHGKNPLFINSVGGSLEAALEIASLVRLRDLTVVVLDECSSACVLVAVASNELMALPDARFGFHRGSIFGNNQSRIAEFWAKTANDTLMQELRRSGIPESVLTIAERTPPEQMHYVSAEQMRVIGLVKTILE